MKRLLAIALLVAACGGSTTSPAPTSTPNLTAATSPTTTPGSTLPAASSAAAPRPTASQTAPPIDAAAVAAFKAASARLDQGELAAGRPAESDWPAWKVAFRIRADALRAFSVDLEAISFPEAAHQDAKDLIFWSKEMETVYRQVGASSSWEAAMQESIEFDGSSYPMRTFIQDATGEYGASVNQMWSALGSRPSSGSAPPLSPSP